MSSNVQENFTCLQISLYCVHKRETGVFLFIAYKSKQTIIMRIKAGRILPRGRNT